VAFDAVPAGVSVGEMGEVTLRLPGVRQALVVPTAALRMRNGRAGVWVQGPDRLNFVAVRTGIVGAEGLVQVLDGLKEGDAVILHSERDLAEDTRVKPVAAIAGSGS